MKTFKLFLKLPLNNKLLIVILLAYYPIIKAADFLNWLSERLYDVGYEILKWASGWK